MKSIQFNSVTSETAELFLSLMRDYAKELDEHQNRNTEPAALEKWTNSIIRKSESESFRILRLCYVGGKIVGFLYATIDQPDDKGYHRTGHGYIMEFYVLPEHRRKSYGRIMVSHIEQFFREQGVSQMYLTSDPVTGKPFWSALGFTSKGEFSPDNGQEIFEKDIIPYHAEKADISAAVYITMLYGKNVETLHGNEIGFNEWREALSANDEDEAHFLIYKGAIPVAWLKINGLRDNSSWISMLAVEPKYQRQGVGSFAVDFAEQYCKFEDKKQLFVKTTEDNIAAHKLYLKCGFDVCDTITYTTGDGVSRTGSVFIKKLD